MTHTVSVIMPAYNAAAYVGRAIESALAQTHPPLEILVVDDGSTDHTADVVASYEPAVRLVCKPNGGPASARNLGAKLARGRWLGLLDADDWWQPNKLSVQLECATNSKIGLIHCLPDHRTETVPNRILFDDLWKKNWIINSSVLIRRDVFDLLGGFDEAKELISVEDYNFWLRVAASDWQIVTCQEVLVHYTRGIGISANTDRFMRASLYNIDALQARLGLDAAMADSRRNEIIFEFARQALYERDLVSARKFFRQALSGDRSPRKALYLMASLLPAPVLNIKRHAAKRLHVQHSPSERPAEFISNPTLDSPTLGSPTLGSPTLGSVESTGLSPLPYVASQSLAQRQLALGVTGFRQPMLVTTIDAEEDFDWDRPFSRSSTTVTSMRSQHLAHRVFDRFGVVPTYLVDYPVASKPEGHEPLLDLLKDGRCDIGAQLHPWVTPPFVERVSPHNSYQGNLSGELELAKMRVLTAEIENTFGVRPRIFRAGRYGAGPDTACFLRQLDYKVDSSVLPCWSFRHASGPDFRGVTAWPYWMDEKHSLLELPISAAIVGRASGLPQYVTSPVFGQTSNRIGLPSALARLGLLERIKLTPEGITIDEAKRLVRHMIRFGHKVFVLTYHSPSLEIGNTPYVKTAQDLDKFLGWIQEFLEFFLGEMNGRVSTWSEVYDLLQTL
jgi:glycosyltransferase involved in cell wall biosynthesis